MIIVRLARYDSRGQCTRSVAGAAGARQPGFPGQPGTQETHSTDLTKLVGWAEPQRGEAHRIHLPSLTVALRGESLSLRGSPAPAHECLTDDLASFGVCY